MISRNSLNGKWPTASLGEVVEFLDHLRRPVTAKDREPGPYPYYGANGQQDSVSDFIFDEPLVLLAEDGGHFGDPNKTIAYHVSGRCWVNNHAHVLRPTNRIDIRFLCHHLEKYDVRPFTSGTTRLKLTKGKAEQIPLALPPLPEQKRIADILDKADTIRRKRQESRSFTQEMPLATFRETFKEYLQVDATQTPLNEVAEVVSGVAKGRKLKDAETREVPYLRVANVQAGYLDLNEIKTIPAKESEISDLTLQRGDVVMTEGGDHDKLGRGALWEHDVPNCIHQNHVFRVRVNQQHLLPTFFVHFLQTQIAKAYFLRCAKKTTNLASINMTQLRALPVPLPPVELQEQFDKEFRTVTDVISRQSEAEEKADDLFNSLVQRAFKGEL